MIKMDEDFVRTLFIDSFENEINYENEELNKEFQGYFSGIVSIRPACIMYDDIIDEQVIEVDHIRFDNITIKDISYDVKKLGNGYMGITGKADIDFNIIAMGREIYSDSYGSFYEDFELTDGSDTGSCTISFTFTEDRCGFYRSPSGFNFVCYFEVI